MHTKNVFQSSRVRHTIRKSTLLVLILILITGSTSITQAGNHQTVDQEIRVTDIAGIDDRGLVRGSTHVEALVEGNEIDRVVFELDGPVQLARTDDDYPYTLVSGNAEWDTTNDPDGRYTLTTTVYDTEGQSSSYTESFRIANTVVGTSRLDDLDSMELIYDASDQLEITSAEPQRFNDDASRLIRDTTDPEWVIWQLNGVEYFSIVGYHWNRKAVRDPSFFVSPDNETYTEVTPIIDDRGGRWIERHYTLTNLPPGTNYVKFVFPANTVHGTTPQIGQVRYSSISLIDQLDTLDQLHDYSSQLEITTTTPELFNDDTNRLVRQTTTGNEWATWRLDGTRTFAAMTYRSPDEEEQDFTFHISSDDQEYTEITPTVQLLGGDWERQLYVLNDLPEAIDYVKVTFPEMLNDNDGVQLGQVQYSNIVAASIDPAHTVAESQLALGTTHTRFTLSVSGAQPGARARAEEILKETVRYQNQHIMGWGASNPNPAPGDYNWGSLDWRINTIRDMNAEPVITLCCAPDWMKGGEPGKTNWDRLNKAPFPEHYDDFADLAARVAERYPDIEYFLVWNELKGFWNSELGNEGNYDYYKYTEFYNKVYDAVKAVRPDAKIGGPYIIIEGTGSNKGNWATRKPIRARQWTFINYWLEHKHGADFIVVDRGLIDPDKDKNPYTTAERMALTPYFGSIATQLRTATDLPIWWGEWYTPRLSYGPAVPAIAASSLYHMLINDSSVALSWNPMDQGGSGHPLFVDVRKPNGGAPTVHYPTFRAFNQHFSPGTAISKSISSSIDVEILSSDTATIIINKRPHGTDMNFNGTGLVLNGYEVEIIEH